MTTARTLRWSDLRKREPELLWLQREILDLEIVARFTVPGEPVSKARARYSPRNNRYYTPTNTQTAETTVGWAFRQSGVGRGGPDPTSTFGACLAFFSTERTRRDTDNMTKLIFDALNGIAWRDDSQVTEHSARLVRGCAAPRTEVVIYRTEVAQ